MALSIKDPETDRLIRELAKLADEPMTTAVRKAVEERLKRERLARGGGRSLVEEVEEMANRLKVAPVYDDRTPDEIVGYDENGMW